MGFNKKNHWSSYETMWNPHFCPVVFQLTDEHKLALAYGYWVSEAVEMFQQLSV